MTPPGVCVFVDTYPELSQTFVANEIGALAALRFAVRVEAGAPAELPDPAPPATAPVHYGVEDPRRLGDLVWLITRAPLRCLADLRARRRWRREEPVPPLRELAAIARRVRRSGDRHLHAHFAAGAALRAMRLGRLLDLPYSVTAHGYDIFRTRRNLVEKLTSATFATSGSDFTLAELRRLLGDHPARLEKIVMGVDGERFRRRTPLPARGPVLAVGRLVAKKGFVTLVEAAAQLRDAPGFEGIEIIGDGPEHDALAARIAELGIDGLVRLAGPRTPDEVRAALERASVVAIPSVIAPDGDADSMPVIAKEALAMEVCVVGSDVAGLPEVVRAPWGTLVAPGDATALAAAIGEILQRPSDERAHAGAAGRAHVVEALGLTRQTTRLGDLIAAAIGEHGSANRRRWRVSSRLRGPHR
jgi:colanic acid/amylovoran biosynthesis glycosyltransferase